MRLIAFTLLLLAGCATAAESSDDALVRVDEPDALDALFELEVQHRPLWVREQGLGELRDLGDPSWEAHEAYAFALADFAERASETQALAPAYLAELARRADGVRNRLLGCREPLWDLARFDPVAVAVEIQKAPETERSRRLQAAFPRYVRELEANLVAGRAEDHVAPVEAVDAAVARLDRWLSSVASPGPADRDAELWLRPALRRYRKFLVEELRPAATLPTTGIPRSCEMQSSTEWKLVLEAWRGRYMRRLPR